MHSITFENRKFKIREIESRIIASTDLNNILITTDGNYKTDEARFIDEQIYFFVEPENLNLSYYALSCYLEKKCV